MTVVSSADEYIERKKNRAIGRGISSSSGFLTFADNNLQGNHTNNLSVTNAKEDVEIVDMWFHQNVVEMENTQGVEKLVGRQLLLY